MTYAIIETGGKQLWVEPGRFYDVERLNLEPEASISIEKVLLVHDGQEATVGQPLVKGATVEATVMQHLRDRKIIVYKMQPKKKTRKKRGHRQELTRLMIDAIVQDGNVIGGKTAQTASTKTKAKATEPAPEPAAEAAVDVAAADA